ncbi:hypothetical protein [Streptomyces sp. bgisy022]
MDPAPDPALAPDTAPALPPPPTGILAGGRTTARDTRPHPRADGGRRAR